MKNLLLPLLSILVLLTACEKKQEAQPAQECATCSTEVITTTFHGGNASTAETTYAAMQRCDDWQHYDGMTSTDTTYNSWDGAPQVAHWSHTTCQ